MPRRPTIARKTKYEEQLAGTALTLDQFTNKLMRGGKRQLAARILENAIARCEKQAARAGVEVKEAALRNAMPLIDAARKRTGKSMGEKLAFEFMDAANGVGAAVKRREDTHRMAEANKAFSH